MRKNGKWNEESWKRGLTLVKKPVMRVTAEAVGLREGSTGRLVVMLPRVWAVGDADTSVTTRVAEAGPRLVAAPEQPGARPKVEVAFYRKYTEAMLRKYLRLSTATGRVPSLLGRELFRGNVTHYQVQGFEDAVIFCMDVERCLAKLTGPEKALIRRVSLQEYTHAEAAGVLGISLRTVTRNYWTALDRVTEMFLEGRLLESLKSCQ